MDIKIIYENKKEFIELLLLADEQESMIEKYLERGELFALYDSDIGSEESDAVSSTAMPKSVCVVTREINDICELKNIATCEKHQRKGYGSKLLDYIFSYYKGKYRAMLVGTGDVPWIIHFYQQNGFEISHRSENFFTDNYDHEMFDNGVQLVDMVYLSKTL